MLHEISFLLDALVLGGILFYDLQDQILWKYLYFSHTFTNLFTIDSYVLNKMICGSIAPGSCFQLSF